LQQQQPHVQHATRGHSEPLGAGSSAPDPLWDLVETIELDNDQLLAA